MAVAGLSLLLLSAVSSVLVLLLFLFLLLLFSAGVEENDDDAGGFAFGLEGISGGMVGLMDRLKVETGRVRWLVMVIGVWCSVMSL